MTEALATLLELIERYGGDLDSLWDRFSMYNLATGSRAGELESYRDAAAMRGLAVGEIVLSAGVDATRYYPLTSHYYEFEWNESFAWMGA